MQVKVNGEGRETDAATIAQFLDSLGQHARLVVVEQNGEIVPRERYSDALLHEDDVLEIVQMMAGG